MSYLVANLYIVSRSNISKLLYFTATEAKNWEKDGNYLRYIYIIFLKVSMLQF
jgi:hypothetical protein